MIRSRHGVLAAVLCLIPCPIRAQSAGDIDVPTPDAQHNGTGSNPWFDTTDVDMGTHLEGEKALAKFAFKNPREEAHKLRNFQPNCACAHTVIRVGDRVYRLENEPVANSIFRVTEANGSEEKERVQFITVGAGETGEVEVEVDLRGVNGRKDAAVTVQTSDETLPMVNLKCHALATSFFQVMPNEVNLNKMGWNDKRDFIVQITSPIQPDFEITGHDELPEQMHVTYRKQMHDGKATWIVNGSYGPNIDPRAGGGIVNLHTDVQEKRVAVRVVAWVEGPLKVNPGTFLALGRVRRDEGAVQVVEFEPTDEFDLQIESVEVKNLTIPEKFVKVRAFKDGKLAKLEVKIEPGAPRRLARGDILVNLNHPAAKQKELQFNGFVR